MSTAEKKNLKPKVIYQDDHLFLVNKPGGWVTLKVKTYQGITLQDWVNNNVREVRKALDGREAVCRSGIVHRLDKDTWGIVLGAKNQQVFENLQNQFKQRLVKKTYNALIHGELKTSGKVVSPVGRLSYNRFKYGVKLDGKPAETKFEPIKNYRINGRNYTLVKVWPKTGRTHQIRVHFKYLGHPLWGDSLYGGKESKERSMFLVAQKISFFHPGIDKRVKYQIGLPDKLKKILENYD